MKILVSMMCLLACFEVVSAGDDGHPHAFFTAGWNSGGPAIRSHAGEVVWQLESQDEITDG